MNLNFMGSVIPTQCVVANMKRQKSGRIVLCSSQVILQRSFIGLIISLLTFCLDTIFVHQVMQNTI